MASIYYKGNKYFGGTGASYGGASIPPSTLGSDGDYYYLISEGVAAVVYVKLNGTWIEVYGGDVIIQEGEKYYAEYGQFKIVGNGNLGMEGTINE